MLGWTYSRKKEAVRPWPWCGNEACAFEKQKGNKCGWSIMRDGDIGLRRSERFTPSLSYLLTAMKGHWKAFTPSCTGKVNHLFKSSLWMLSGDWTAGGRAAWLPFQSLVRA